MKNPKPDSIPSPAAGGGSDAFWTRQSALLSVFLAVTALSAIAFAGSNAAIVLYHLLTDGLIILVWLIACYGIGGLLPLPSGEGRDDGAPGSAEGPGSRDSTDDRTLARALSKWENGPDLWLCRVTRIAVGLGVMSLATLGFGLLGTLNQLTEWLIIAIGLALAGAKFFPSVRTPAPPVEPAQWLWLLVAPFLGLSLVAAIVPPGVLWGDEPNGYDVVEYHLQVPREWYEAGRITPLEHNVFSYFPFNVEMHDLLAMHLRGGPFEAMYLAQLMHVAWGVLFLAAVWAVVRSMASAKSARLAAIAAAVVPWTGLLAPIAYNESGLLLFGTLALGWALQAIKNSPATGSLAVAGAMAGFAAGAKLTAIPILCVALPLAILIASRRRRSLIVPVLLFMGISIVAFSPWAIRNAIWTRGNPVFPEAQSIFGSAHFSDVQTDRWQRAHSPREDQIALGARTAAFFDQVVLNWRYGFLLLPAGLASIVLCWRKREAWLLGLVLAALLVFWLGFTHLQGRFFVLAIPIAAMLIGLIEGKIPQRIMMAVIAISAVFGFASLAARWNELDDSFAARTGGTVRLNQLLGLSLDRWEMNGHEPLREDQTLVLVGDAEAFLYQTPMKQLRYRTVFDADTAGDRSVIDAWTEGTDELPGRVILVDPGSLQRFHDTYFAIPPLSEAVPGPRDRPFILDQP